MYKIDNIFTEVMQSKNNDNYEKLKTDIKKDDLCFILGAGVSQSMGLPNWQKLLSEGIGGLLYNFDGKAESNKDDELTKIFENALKKAYSKFKEGMNGKNDFILNGSNLLEIAEYILNYCNAFSTSNNPKFRYGIAEKQLVSLINECLYCNTKKLERKFSNQYKGSTLEAVTNIIAKDFQKKGGKQVTVITYNYDNLLELSLKKEKNISEDKIKTISYNPYRRLKEEDLKSIMKIEENKINICHIHGYIDISNYESACSGLVLSESSYHDLEDHQYDWINTYQANAMQNHICLLVGFSGEDTNFRRIVRKNSEGESYIFFTVDDIVKKVFSNIATKINPVDIVLEKRDNYPYEMLLLLFMIQAKTKYWENLGIHPIWTTLEELPQKIKGLL